MYNLRCPICLRDIPAERVVSASAYCPCGHVLNMSQGDKDPNSSSSSVILLMFTSIIIAAILHAFNWDGYFFTIIPLKMKQLVGIAKVEDLREIATICQKRNKANCETQALQQAFAIDPRELEGLVRVGEIQSLKGYHEGVVQTFTTYFKSGGKNNDGRYTFAKSLGELGQFKDSQKQFSYILQKDQKKPQYQVARSYVELLIKNHEYNTARTVIEEYRRSGSSSALFLEKEWKIVNGKLGTASSNYKTASKQI